MLLSKEYFLLSKNNLLFIASETTTIKSGRKKITMTVTVKNNGSHILVVYQNHLESLLKYRLWDGAETYISNKFTGIANAAVLGNII